MNAFHRGIGGALCVGLIGGVAWAGDLNPPPGPVNPTDDVVLNAQAILLPYVITQPGAYRLTSNFVGSPTDGIQIQSDDVWLDLGGFTLDGAGALGDGIVLQGPFHSVTILNGSVINWGDDGIDLALGSDCRVMNVDVRNNFAEGIEANRSEIIDCMALANGFDGIVALDHSIVERCRATTNGMTGIRVDNGSKVADCVASLNGSTGIDAFLQCIVLDCTASDNTNGPGIIAGENSKVADCVSSRNFDGIVAFIGGIVIDSVAAENGNTGVFADLGCVIDNCKATRNTDGFVGLIGTSLLECSAIENLQYGFYVDSGVTIRDCNASLNSLAPPSGAGAAGIWVGSECEIVGNHVWQTQFQGSFGIEVTGIFNRVSDNDSKSNFTNYQFQGTATNNTVFGNSATNPLNGPAFNYVILGFPNDVAPVTTAAAGASRLDNIAY